MYGAKCRGGQGVKVRSVRFWTVRVLVSYLVILIF